MPSIPILRNRLITPYNNYLSLFYGSLLKHVIIDHQKKEIGVAG